MKQISLPTPPTQLIKPTPPQKPLDFYWVYDDEINLSNNKISSTEEIDFGTLIEQSKKLNKENCKITLRMHAEASPKYYDDAYDSSAELSIKLIRYKKKSNKDFEKQLKKYNKDLEKYNLDLKYFEEKEKIYNKEMKEYQAALNEWTLNRLEMSKKDIENKILQIKKETGLK